MPFDAKQATRDSLSLAYPVVDLLKRTRDPRARTAIVKAAKECALLDSDFLTAACLRDIETRWRRRYYV